MYIYKATVKAVHDGDTFTAIVDLGFRVQAELKIRLNGINTPELIGPTKPAGLISRDRLIQLVLNKEVILKTKKDKQEKYGRWLADVFLTETDTKSVNQILLDEGLAVIY